jgi:RND family efflux transporter MFP subunit
MGWGRVRSTATVIFALILLLGNGCASDAVGQTSERGQTTAPARPSTPAALPVSQPETPPASDTSFPSYLYVERDVWVTARASGIIEELLVDRGDRVKVGEPLIVLETDIRKGELRIAEQQSRLAEAEFERSRSLHEQQIVSAQEALKLEIERDLAASEVELARAQLERCTVRAPFDGIVIERRAVVGLRVIEDDAVDLLRIAANDPLRAKVHLPERLLSRATVGNTAEIVTEDAPPRVLPGRVVFVSPAIDPASGTALVIVEAAERSPWLRLGQAVGLRLASSEAQASAEGQHAGTASAALLTREEE